jgi:hypothetical protein
MQATRNALEARRSLDSAQSEKTTLMWELQELSTAARSRIQALCIANVRLDRRTHDLNRQLLGAVPVRAYVSLLDRYHTALVHRRKEAILTNGKLLEGSVHDPVATRRLAEVEIRYMAACKRAAAAEEGQAGAEKLLKDPAGAQNLLGDLRQRAVELESARVQMEVAERRAVRLQEDVEEAQKLLRSVQEDHARLAQRVTLSDACTAYSMLWRNLCSKV